jgi:hypothetical protein
MAEVRMTIEINRPEVEALINVRLQSGLFKDAEDVIFQALQSSSPEPRGASGDRERTLASVFEAAKGLADDIEFGRNPSMGRATDFE